jgi:sugar (pentulose or hexulose) kinase
MAVCGGLSASPVCVQILADVCNVPIRAVAGVDAALRGAASVALAAVGDADLGPAPTVSVVQPRAEHASIHHVLATVFDTSLRQLGPAFGALASIRRSISNNHFTQGEQT